MAFEIQPNFDRVQTCAHSRGDVITSMYVAPCVRSWQADTHMVLCTAPCASQQAWLEAQLWDFHSHVRQHDCCWLTRDIRTGLAVLLVAPSPSRTCV